MHLGVRKKKKSAFLRKRRKCIDPGLNQGPLDLQSNALPGWGRLGEDRLIERGKREKKGKKEGKNRGKEGKRG